MYSKRSNSEHLKSKQCRNPNGREFGIQTILGAFKQNAINRAFGLVQNWSGKWPSNEVEKYIPIARMQPN